MSRKPTNGRLYENCRAVATGVARQPVGGRRSAVGGRRSAVGAKTMRRADAWRHAMPARFAPRTVEPTVGRLLSTELPPQPTCHGSRPTVGSTKIVVPWQPTCHGSRPTASGRRSAVGAKAMRRADAWRHAMPARFAPRTVEPTVGRLLSTPMPAQPTCHGSRPTVGSTKLSCRGNRRGTAADQRSARRQCGMRIAGAMPCPRGSPRGP